MRTKNVWWGNQGILGVGNRYDNISLVEVLERLFNFGLIHAGGGQKFIAINPAPPPE